MKSLPFWFIGFIWFLGFFGGFLGGFFFLFFHNTKNYCGRENESLWDAGSCIHSGHVTWDFDVLGCLNCGLWEDSAQGNRFLRTMTSTDDSECAASIVASIGELCQWLHMESNEMKAYFKPIKFDATSNSSQAAVEMSESLLVKQRICLRRCTFYESL